MKYGIKKPEMIWIKNEMGQDDNQVCFRRKINNYGCVSNIELDIWADSRYYLWLNGNFTGTGPSRCWPEYPQKDNYKLEFPGDFHEVQIAVLVWHYGMSTSQYIHGPAGLIIGGKCIDVNNEEINFSSDINWKCRIHKGYINPVPRINVSQPSIEMFDASVFPEIWMSPDFDDSTWSDAEPSGAGKLEFMQDRDIPLLSTEFRHPVNIVKEHFVHCRGIGVRVDYKKVFYPEDRTTEDRLQTGYLCFLINSYVKQVVKVTLADRLWPETDEYIYLNGVKYTMTPGRKDINLVFQEGENLVLLDVSGARQRFTSDLHFLPENDIRFLNLFSENVFVTALGPFESIIIGNIVCVDGFKIDYKASDYMKAGLCKTKEELVKFKKWLHPVENSLFDGVKLRSTGAEFKPIPHAQISGTESLFFKASNQDGDYEIIIDMGIEVSGYLTFHVEAEESAELDFRFFEFLSDNIPEIPDDLDTSLRYICAGGCGSFRSLIRRGFRYITIRSRAGCQVVISELCVDEQLYPVVKRGVFNSSDCLLNDIWRMCRRTVELCSEDALIDSPAFEQAFWTGDAYVMALYHQYLFGETNLIKHSLFLAARSMDYSELPDCHLPAGVHLLLTAWAQLWMLAGRDYYMHTGDEESLKELYPWIKKAAVSFFKYIDKSGLFKIDAWNMLDWASMDTPYKGTVAHLNARLSACFRVVSELSGILKLADDEHLWKLRADALAKKTDEIFWNEERQCYIDSIHEDGKRSEVISVQTNLMMILYGCAASEHRASVESFILNPPLDAVKPGSPFLAHFYYEYLFSLGMGAQALEGIRNQWQPMLETGTCWETFIGFYKDRLTRSYCHAWSSAPAYLFGAWVLGVRPLTPGFKKILIAPQISGLNHAEGVVPIPDGDVYINWKLKNDELCCEIRLPHEIECVFNPVPGSWSRVSLIVNDKLQEWK